ncbi:GNAT family N-acetyltransferase [Phycicoccus flavus]|uniref:GNAT family N-acetyltransferase n=1 Tax=Phycicoccus flavus TaxID=2502783 RepID=UPI000FEB756F|nr:GNAT family N-acetyltransferase [Phycicoccus flavus]NHA67729.1 GNAT family N-acetyltransferase [Phycicoccus flavus]
MPQEGDSANGRLKFLLDSNVVIAVEPFSGELEENIDLGVRFLRLANEQRHLLCVAPATRDDLLEGKDASRRRQRIAELGKFHQLAEAPITSDLTSRAGTSVPGSNDERDLRLLAEVESGAVTYLVTDDARLRRRAARAGLGDRALSLADAVTILAGFEPTELTPPPRVSTVPCYAIDPEDKIFEGLRSDYPEFDEWFAKVRQQSDTRRCFVIEEDGAYAALGLLKFEGDCEYSIAGPVVKMSTFKVSEDHSGVKYGELLLKAILHSLTTTESASLYVEVLPSHPEVLDFLAAFGFVDQGYQSARGEHVLTKSLRPPPDGGGVSDLEYHVIFGPPALLCRQRIFAVPIEPRWHDQLFPEQAPPSQSAQLALFGKTGEQTHPWGNALRKAYLCNAATNQVAAGDVLLFYLSRGRRFSAVGIVEEVLRSTEPDEVMRFVGRRTVYSASEITEMARRARGVLAIRFRQDRFLEPPITLTDMKLAGALRSWPQSITRLREEGMPWMRDLLVG